MKKFNSHLQLVLILAFISLTPFYTVNAQSIQTWPLNATQGHFGYSINNLPNGVTSAFWVLGDGHFRSGLYIDHYFKSQANDSVQVYLLEQYEINPPKRFSCGNCNGVDTSTLSNPLVAMSPNQALKIGTSWNPVLGGMHYTILTFENTGATDSGTIVLTFGTEIDSFDVEGIDNNPDWVENLTVGPNHLMFSFSELQPGEQRHLLVKTVVTQNLSADKITYSAHLWNTSGGQNVETNGAYEIKRYPHDPNDKIVNIEEMCSYNLDATTLEYTITFQNIGVDYAREVTIIDDLHPDLDITTIQVLDYSDPYQFNIDTSTNRLEFIFSPIELPGLDQTIPYIFHPNETIGFITFSIETKTCLPPGDIDNMATIRFDNLGDIDTPFAITQINYFEDCSPSMDACTGVNEDDDLDPIDIIIDPIDIGGGNNGNNGGGNGGNNGGGSGGSGEGGMDFQDTPDNNNLLDRSRAISNSDIDNRAFGIFPNPATDLFTIRFELTDKQDHSVQLAVYNVQGKIIRNLSGEISDQKGRQEIRIDATTWPGGIYFVKLESTNEIHTWKLIKL